MPNRDTEIARKYHASTSHSPRSVRESLHFLDWENQPLAFKLYEDLEPIPLEVEKDRLSMPAMEALCERNEPAIAAPDIEDLAALLFFSAGITRRRQHRGGEILFRAASNTGALYQVELYVVCGELEGLAAGVYHYGPRDQALHRLREGDFRGVLARATAGERAVAGAPAIIVSTGTYWRNAWKYQARAYRHFGWDNGTIHANLLAAANALGLPARLVCGFVDDDVNGLLALDAMREVSLALVALGLGSPAPPPLPVPELRLRTKPLSARETDYPLMREMHAASSLATPEEAAAWRSAPAPRPPGDAAPFEAPGSLPMDSLGDVVLRRGSSRRFERKPIEAGALEAILARAACGLDADFLEPGAMLNELYVIVHAVDGVPSGAYYYDAASRRLEPLKHGDFRDAAAFLALDQDLAGDAAAAVFFMADLDRWLGRLGNRAYRAVQLEAGIAGGRVYLGAYALRLGATGLTFFDDEVTRFFSPHAAGKSAIFLMAVGHPYRPSRPPAPPVVG
jgi:SagB-type dehydrogenase family enzyme